MSRSERDSAIYTAYCISGVQVTYSESPIAIPQDHLELASEKGASNWLTVLPVQDLVQEHGFSLQFHDAIALRYGWDPIH